MSKLPQLRPRRVIRALERAGFVIHHTTGSHYALVKDNLTVIVPYHGSRDIKTGTLRSIIAQAGMTIEEFLRHL